MAGRRRGDPRVRALFLGVAAALIALLKPRLAEARMIGAIVAQLIGLFVDDEFLAAAILAAVAVASALMLRRRAGLGRRPRC